MRRGGLLLAFVFLLCIPAAPANAAARSLRQRAAPRAFASCADLIGYGQRHFAVTHGVPDPSVGVPDQVPPARLPAATDQAAGLQAPAAAPAPSAGAATPVYSTTNNQEAGVDEPDIAKTDGRTLFTVAAGKLYAVALGGTGPSLAGSLDLGNDGYSAQLLLHGTRLIVISSSGAGLSPLGGRARAGSAPAFYGASTTIREIDVHDPTALKLTRTMTIDGAFVDARQNGATARLVINSPPRAIAFAAGRRGTATASAWVPSRRFHSSLTGRSYVRAVAPCTTIRRPVDFSGLGMLTIFTLDLERGLYTADTAALMADAQVVYGSTGSLYVATHRWIDPQLPVARVPVAQATVINRFDVSDPTRTTLVASGEVPGYLLNQFSLSEYQGYLRVASTSQPIWWGGGPPQTLSHSSVTVLAQRGAVLLPVGQVTGLGAGQQIYSVRFVAETGYVVTFRQVDPLYTIDLRSPVSPKIAGQLELTGYSSYLHPLGPGLLLGVGQDIGGQINEPTGSQLELFDVADPQAPRLIQKVTLGAGSSSEVQYDHHAFLFWPPNALAVLPVEIFPTPLFQNAPGGIPLGVTPPIRSPPPGFVGAIGYRVDHSGITEVGRIAIDATGGLAPTIRRSIVVGGSLLSISDAGVLSSKLDTLARQAFLPFPNQTPRPVPLLGGPVATR